VGKIITAYDGEEAFKALEQLSQRPPSGKCLILLDINMPVMNGWEFLELYENKPHLHQTNDGIFILTGSINPEDKKKAERHSYVSGFIEKPLDTDSLSEILFPD
ncbi:MAG: response regulator, partial [Saprospiraceae bacterium]|nr:response regulator [Saprospiraceae bacterium]